LAGCTGKKITPTPAPFPTLAPIPSGTDPSVDRVILSRDKDGKTNTSTFKAEDEEIYLLFEASNLPENTQVRSVWYIQEGEDRENKISEFTMKAGENINSGCFNLSRPSDGWQGDNYKVKLYFNDKMMKNIPFTIELNLNTPEVVSNETPKVPHGTTSFIEGMYEFYLKTDMTYGNKNSKFTVWINDEYVGFLDTDTVVNISSKIRQGENTVAINTSISEELLSPINLTIGTSWRGKEMPLLIHRSQEKGEETVKYKLNIPDTSKINHPSVKEDYNLKLDMTYGTPKTSFNVFINGYQIGIYSKDVTVDITPFIKTGQNEVKIISIVDSELIKPVSLIIGSFRWKRWATVMSHSRKKTGTDTAVYKLTIPDLSRVKKSVTDSTYTLRTDMTFGSDRTQFDVSINNMQIGIFNQSTSVDVSHYLKTGRNLIDITSDIEEDLPKDVILTIGIEKHGGWSTLMNYARRLKGKDKASYEIVVQGESLAMMPTDQCTMKVDMTFHKEGTAFTIYINGILAGTFETDTSIDVTGFFNKGANEIKIVSQIPSDLVSDVKVSIGAYRNGKWATLLSHGKSRKGNYTDVYNVMVK